MLSYRLIVSSLFVLSLSSSIAFSQEQIVSASVNGRTTDTYQFDWTIGNFASSLEGVGVILTPILATIDVSDQQPLHITDDLQFSFYPNPVENVLVIESKNVSYSSYQLIDNQGQTLRNGSIVSKSFVDMTNIKNGIYFLMILGGKPTKTIKIIKSK